jgi:hypothetical protein
MPDVVLYVRISISSDHFTLYWFNCNVFVLYGLLIVFIKLNGTTCDWLLNLPLCLSASLILDPLKIYE